MSFPIFVIFLKIRVKNANKKADLKRPAWAETIELTNRTVLLLCIYVEVSLLVTE